MMSQMPQHGHPQQSQQIIQSHQQPPNATTNNTRLLAHTLENRKRVLQTLIREKADTLV